MTQTFNKAITRIPCKEFPNGLTGSDLGPPDLELALNQHLAYRNALSELGLELLELDSDVAHPDSTFVEDTAVVTPEVAVITRPGADSRLGEIESISTVLESLRPIERIVPDGRVDGGDVLQADDTFYIGISARTDSEGASQLSDILNAHGYDCHTVRIEGCLHLKSAVNYLGNNTMLVDDRYQDLSFLNRYKLVTVPEEESYAANSLLVNGVVLVPAGFPRTLRNIQNAGVEILILDTSEFMKMDGGLSCLSLRF
jgi:dimethylargininase